jgi:hypothetical protein
MTNVSKGKSRLRRVPPPGTPEFERWRRNVVSGMRKAGRRRRAAGLLTLRQVSAQYGLPLCFVRRKVSLGELRVIRSGQRAYVRADEAQRAFGEGSTAA